MCPPITFSVTSVWDGDSSTSSMPGAESRRQPTQQRRRSTLSSTVVSFLWLQTLGQLLVGGLTSLTEAASSDGSPASVASSSSSSSCPPACFCNAPSRIVYCSRRGLTAVPDSIAANSLQLNLNGNVFASPILRRGNFSGLSSLEHLYLSECGIERLEVGTFAGLSQLRWLDLSNNRIRALADGTFAGLTLQHLFLNGNRHVQLVARSFEGLVTTGLYLHDCSLSRLPARVLTPLNATLQLLWLNGNELTVVDAGLRPLFGSLSHLRLGSNPLHCNCETAWLKEAFDRSPDTFRGAAAPSCLTPARLRGRYFADLLPTDFRCQAPAFSDIETAFGADAGGARLRCTAAGDPAPTLYWIQPSGKTTRYEAPVGDDARRNVGLLTVRDTGADSSATSSLFGMYICVANNEAGNVTLTINVSWPFASSNGISSTVAGGQYQTPLSPPSSVQSGAALPTSRSHVDRARRGNYTVIDVTASVDDDDEHEALAKGGDRRRLFTVTELVCAIIGTHLGTLLLCLLVLPLLYRRRRWVAERDKRERTATVARLQPPAYACSPDAQIASDKVAAYRQQPLPPLPAESVYLNGTPYSTVRRPAFLTDYLITPQR